MVNILVIIFDSYHNKKKEFYKIDDVLVYSYSLNIKNYNKICIIIKMKVNVISIIRNKATFVTFFLHIYSVYIVFILEHTLL